MEPEKFCKPCDFGYDGAKSCAGNEFYPRKGFCPAARIGGMNVEMDCFNIHIEEKVIPREDKSRLIEIIERKLEKFS